MRLRRGRISLRDTMRAGLAGQRLYAAGVADDDPRKQANDERLDRLAASIAPKRAARIRRPVDGKPALPLEKHVLAEVLQALRRDLRVALIDRRQSGAFMEGDRWITVGTPGTLDISGMLVGGRYFEIECKRPGQKPDERQALRIARIVKGGGISGYATSAEEAIALLP